MIFARSDATDEIKTPIGMICGWIACDKVFNSRKQILSHINKVHEKPSKAFKCDYQDCFYEGRTASHLALHRRNHMRLKHLSNLGLNNHGCLNGKKVSTALLKALYDRSQLTEEPDPTNEHITRELS